MRYQELTESKLKTVYHGDDYNTLALSPSLMNNGNNQEGIGIYFSDRQSTAEYYGKHVISAEINLDNFISARTTFSEISVEKIAALLHALRKYDEEAMFYMVSDYIIVTEPSEVEEYHIDELATHVRDEQIRNFQVTLAENFGVENFVKEWNQIIGIDGTYEPRSENEMWYAIINPNIKITRVSR